MEIINEKIQQYTERYTSSHDELLQRILKETYDDHPHAHMVSGMLQGKLLQMISHMIRPLRVLEIGTFTGFSAMCLAAGLQRGGMLHTIELRKEDAEAAQKNFIRTSCPEKFVLHTGDAKNIIPLLQEEWDLVFIDADKLNYINYYELTLPRLKEGGFILTDNVLFHGEVLEEKISGKNAKAIHAFNEHVAADERTEQVMLSVRDGLSLIRKL